MPKYNLISVGSNAKTNKAPQPYIQGILHLAPSVLSGYQACPRAKVAGCEDPCLNLNGNGGFDSVQEARKRKTRLFFEDKTEFFRQLDSDLDKFSSWCKDRARKPVMRLNGTSDIPWERYGVIDRHKDIEFLDYTKIPERLESRPLPSNYWLSISYSGADENYARKCDQVAFKTGAQLVVVFRGKMPDTFLGRPVVDGDDYDLLFLKPRNTVIGLPAKGRAKKDTSGFVVEV